MASNIVLTGFMGTGKTTVGKLIAQKLGRQFIDTDQVISQQFGKTITEIFATDGEPKFRLAEQELCQQLAAKHDLVISTGGGTLLYNSPFNKGGQRGIFSLSAKPQTILARLKNQTDRPLLATDDPESTIRELLAARKRLYGRFFHQIPTDHQTTEQLADHIIRLHHQNTIFDQDTLWVRIPHNRPYPIIFTDEFQPTLFEWLQINKRPLAIITNDKVFAVLGKELATDLEIAGYPIICCQIPDGEQHKTLQTASKLFEELAHQGFTRDGAIIGLGGGVTLDIAGFVAATYMRGVRLIQIPTTLLAMTDASVGGKTGVDLPQGKNLVGAFKQPLAVVINPNYLTTLPQSEIANGLAEVIKHAIIGDPDLFSTLESTPISPFNKGGLRGILPPSIQVKINIIEQDPHEEDLRAILNLGHTFAHAFEKVSNYQIPHGQAVAVGMVAAAQLSHQLGHCDQSLINRIINACKTQGLPTSFTLDTNVVLTAMQSDKKRSASGLAFVLPHQIGDVRLASNIAHDLVVKALRISCTKAPSC